MVRLKILDPTLKGFSPSKRISDLKQALLFDIFRTLSHRKGVIVGLGVKVGNGVNVDVWLGVIEGVTEDDTIGVINNVLDGVTVTVGIGIGLRGQRG